MFLCASDNTSGLESVESTDDAPSLAAEMLANAVPHPNSIIDLCLNMLGTDWFNLSSSRVKSIPLFQTATDIMMHDKLVIHIDRMQSMSNAKQMHKLA